MGPLDRRDEAARDRAAGRHHAIRSTGPASATISHMLERKGVSPNVASFVGATTVRVHELGEGDVDPTPAQLDRMRALVRAGDERGRDGGRLVAHLRAGQFRRDAGADRAGERGGQMRRHVYQPHPRRGAEAARGDRRADRDLARSPARRPKSTISSSRAATIGARSTRRSPGSRRRGRAGLRITADMYTYPASSTGLDAAMPLWVQEGGIEAWVARLKDPALRAPGAGRDAPARGVGE